MKGNKILATLVVLAMVLSTMVVFNKLDVKIVEEAEALVPGVNMWGYPNNVTTANLVYDPDTALDIDVNTTKLKTGVSYFLYYPSYSRSGSTYNLSWYPYYSSGGVQKSITVTAPGTDETLSGIYLNRSGLWTLGRGEGNITVNGSSWSEFNNTAWSWFWVNTSTTYAMTVSPDEVYYGNNETITVNVRNAAGDLTYSWVDIRFETNESGVPSFPKEASSPNGVVNFSSSWETRLRWAGNYTVVAWYDTLDQPLYQSLGYGYNSTFGSASAINGSADRYNYHICGPWDPPEYNTSYYSRKITCLPGEPTTAIPEANQTMYWSFDGQVNISVKNYDDGNISNLNCVVYNNNDQNVTANVTIGYNTTSKGYIHINSSSWGKDGSHVYGENGSWYAWIWWDRNGDVNHSDPSTRGWFEEWNATVYFTVASAPGVQWKWIDDDGVLSSDNNDGEIPSVPTLAEQPLNIKFQIIGDDHSYYGAAWGANAPARGGKNITVSGDALYLSSKKLNKLGGVSYSGGTWTVPLTPTMALNGGEITFSVSWSGYGTLTESLSVGGYSQNGTLVTISPTEFTIGENVSLSVAVKGATGYPFPNAQVYLHYVYHNGSLISTANGGRISWMNGGGTNDGVYTFLVNTTQQTTNQTTAYSADPDGYTGIRAPRNISAYAILYRGGTPTYVYGYALTIMKPKKDLKVTMEPNTFMAGQKVSKIYFNTTVVDTSGNITDYPEDSGLKVRIFNETDADVTATIGNLATGTGVKGTDGNDNKTTTNIYIQKPGTYTVYAYNNTHNSEGNNATLVVTPVEVTSSLPEFIWNVDKNVTVTFTVKYNGEPVNGTLRIDNMSTVGTTYNRTWTNCSFTPQIGSTSYSHAGGNTSKSETVTNGVVTLYNITANYLPPGVERKNITFYFKPKTPSGSAWAWTSGIIPVKIADVTASPASIPYNKPTNLKITTSGRGTGLANVWVSIIIPGLTGEMNTTTGANGEATFAFTPPTTGNIIIKIENRTSTTKVSVTAWALYADAPSQAGESTDFTVTVRNGTATGAAIADTAVTFNGETKTTDSSGQVTFTAPAVSAHREYTILATKAGHAEDAATILILNIPKLTIIAPAKATTSSTFEVTIADDSGNSVVGATVTFNSVDYTTGAQGITTLTAPSEKGTYAIKATFTGYTAADEVTITIEAGGIPGFELLTLITAIGVAFILLRRRRN